MRKITLLLGGILLIVGVLFVVLSNRKNLPLPPQSTITPTPVPFMLNPLENLGIVSVSPVDNEKDVPLNQTIAVMFNKNVSPDTIVFSLQPETQNHIDFSANTLHVNLLQTLEPKTQYTFVVGYKGTTYSHAFHFTTADVSAPPQDNAAQTNQDWLRGNDPALFLVNYMPQQTDTYTVTYATTTEQPYHYYFTVTLSDSDQTKAKQDFMSWLKSIGLNDTQISSLDIRYQ